MSNDNSFARCAEAVSLIDKFLRTNQKSNSYNRWLERYIKHPSEHDDTFLFGKLVQAIFSGGMKGEVVDNWMPRIEEAFHNWDVGWISRLSANDLERLASSGKVIANHPKLKAIVSNAETVVGLIANFGSFGKYLASFDDIASLSKDIANRFTYLGEVTTEDFLRNIGFDTAKPDRHLTRWLMRMGATEDEASPDQVLEVIYEIAEAANTTRSKLDSAIYLFCADRNDVLVSGGICGSNPDCEHCPIAGLCPRNMVSAVSPSDPGKIPRPSSPNHKGESSPTVEKSEIMNSNIPDIEDLISHIIENPNSKAPSEHYKIGDHPSQYGTTNVKSKSKGREHKLWTPCKDSNHVCFLILKQHDDVFKIQHVLDDIDIDEITQENRPIILKRSPSQSLATSCNTKDQFTGSLEIDLKDIQSNESPTGSIRDLVVSIIDKTIEKDLNKRRRSGA